MRLEGGLDHRVGDPRGQPGAGTERCRRGSDQDRPVPPDVVSGCGVEPVSLRERPVQRPAQAEVGEDRPAEPCHEGIEEGPRVEDRSRSWIPDGPPDRLAALAEAPQDGLHVSGRAGVGSPGLTCPARTERRPRRHKQVGQPCRIVHDGSQGEMHR